MVELYLTLKFLYFIEKSWWPNSLYITNLAKLLMSDFYVVIFINQLYRPVLILSHYCYCIGYLHDFIRGNQIKYKEIFILFCVSYCPISLY